MSPILTLGMVNVKCVLKHDTWSDTLLSCIICAISQVVRMQPTRTTLVLRVHVTKQHMQLQDHEKLVQYLLQLNVVKNSTVLINPTHDKHSKTC